MKKVIQKLGSMLFVLAFIAHGFAFAQTTVTGKVADASNNEPLPGVNISVKGTSTGSVTNIDGEFSLQVADPNAELVFSYIGYINETYSLNGATTVNISLVQDLLSLDELVVVGYGTARKQDLTGSVAVVNTDEIMKQTASDVSAMLKGQVAGVQVSGSGEPGAVSKVKIRGVGSFGTTEPLYVVDGVPLAKTTNVNAGHFAGQFPSGVPSGGISDINPSDIESVQILKDASAAAIYGSRGANGVIIITTKRGTTGDMKVTYDGSYGMQHVTHRYDVTSREQFQEMNNIARANDNQFMAPANNPDDPLYIDNIDTDWQEEVFKRGYITDHSLGFQGGTEKSKYFASINYFDQKGTMEGPGPRYKRYSATLNLDQQKGRFKFGQSFFYAFADQIRLTNSQWATAIHETVLGLPTVPVYDENNIGGFGGGIDEVHDQIAGNQVAFNNLKNNRLKRNRFKGVLYADLEIISGLNYRINASYDRGDYLTHEFYPLFEVGSRHVNSTAFLKQWRGENPYMLMEQTLTFDKNLSGHNLTAMLGHSAQYDYLEENYGYSEGFIPPYLEVISAGPDNQTALGTKYEHRLLSYFGRLVYNYKDRYLLTMNVRKDFSSRFGPENKSGVFPSFSGAWKVHNESFFNADFISLFKIRGGWGKIGHEDIGDYRYESFINNAVTYVFNDQLQPGGIQTNIIDPSIKWEERTTSNIGVDMAFFANKLEFTAEYYNNDANGILYDVPVPWSTGTVINPTVNSASMNNQGFEFVLTYREYDGDLKWNVSANITTLKNEVTKLGTSDEPVLRFLSRTAVGHSMGELYGWDMIGIFQNEEEIAEHATQTNARPGDIKFRDVNEDGIVNDEDRIYMGSAFPTLFGGLNVGLEYGGLDFTLFLTGSYGNKIYNGAGNALNEMKYGNYSIESYENYWRGENSTNEYPRPTVLDRNQNNRMSQRKLEDGSYIRVQNIQLGYTLPKTVINKIPGVESLRFFVGAQNLYTFTRYSGFDPDINNDGLFQRALDDGSYPTPRTINAGVKLVL